MCKDAFGSDCPHPTTAASQDVQSERDGMRLGGRLFFTTFGRLTNCLFTLELARWLADQLNKVVVIPFCASAENTEQACQLGSARSDARERNILVNISAVYLRESAGGCRTRRHAVDLLDELKHTHNVARKRVVTCVGRTAAHCAWVLATNHQFNGIALSRFIRFDLGAFAVAWLKYQRAVDNHLIASTLQQALQRQDQGEPCVMPKGMECDVCTEGHGSSAGDGARCGRGSSSSGHVSNAAAERTLAPCMRDCLGTSIFDAVSGDVFVPNLFEHAGMTDSTRPNPCLPLALSPRAAEQAATLRRQLPARFVCLHWRAGDFLSTEPLSRLHGASMLSHHRALANSTTMAAIAARVARNVGLQHVLVLTNARYERTRAFMTSMRLVQGLNATLWACTDAPPDSEKEVCAKEASALVLSQGSSFSTHLRRMAPTTVPHVYVAGCPTARSAAGRSPLLAGPPILC